MAKLTPATPVAAIGDTVSYYDRQQRFHIGEILRIEASWDGWAADPLIVYWVAHPTYRNGHFCTTEDSFAGRAALRDGQAEILTKENHK